MTTENKVTLNSYANEREYVILFWAGVGCPTGNYALLGNPDDDFADRRHLLDLTGVVDAAGEWRWDGEGEPRDDRANSITKLHAYSDENRWLDAAAEIC
jgi:hypothetical protein